MKLDVLTNLECVGRARVGRRRHLGAQIADDVGGRSGILRVDPNQRAVERCGRMNRRVGLLALRVEARRRICRNYVGQSATVFWRLLGRRWRRRGGAHTDSRCAKP